MTPLWLQHVIVLSIAAACAAVIARQAFTALQGRKSRIAGCGSCKGCAPPEPQKPKTQFIPLEALKRR